MVDDVLEDEDPARTRHEVLDRGQLRALHRRQGAAVQVEAGELLDDVVLADEDRHAVPLGLLHEVGEVGEPAPRHEVAAGTVAGREGPADHLLRLGDVEPALGLGPSPQGHVGEGHEVREPLVGRVGDGQGHGEQARRRPAR